MEGRDGGPTLNCIKGWISFKGRGATIQDSSVPLIVLSVKIAYIILRKVLAASSTMLTALLMSLLRKWSH